MTFQSYFFDLDGTLYNENNGLFAEINRRIVDWVVRTVPEVEDPYKLKDRLYAQYGGTLPGLKFEYGSDYYASMRYCHDIRVEDYVEPNPVLKEMLMELQGNKYIFTSSYRFYANRVLDVLGIRSCFDGIIDAIDVFPTPKPSPIAFQRALEITAEKDVRRCVFIDDDPRNVTAGHREGFFAIQVGTVHTVSPEADAYITGIEDLLTIPELRTEG